MRNLSLVITLVMFYYGFAQKTWSELGGEASTNIENRIPHLDVDSNDNVYISGGFVNEFNKPYVMKFDGNLWKSIGDPQFFEEGSQIVELKVAGNKLYVIGRRPEQGSTFYVFENENWVEVPYELSATIPRLLGEDHNGNLLAVGRIRAKLPNGERKDINITRYTGNSWEVLGPAEAFEENTAARFEDIEVSATGEIYIAVNFSFDRGTPYVIKFNGTSWNKLGSKVATKTEDIQDIAITANNKILAVGSLKDSNDRNIPWVYSDNTWRALRSKSNYSSKAAIGGVIVAPGNKFYMAVGNRFKGSNVVTYIDDRWVPADTVRLGRFSAMTYNSKGDVLVSAQLFNPLREGYYIATYGRPRTLSNQDQIIENDKIVITYLGKNHEKVVFQYPESIAQNKTKLSLYTLEGKNIMSLNNQNTMSIAHLPRGVYLCTIRFGNKSQMVKIVKN